MMDVWLCLGLLSAVGFAALFVIDRYFLKKEKNLVHPAVFAAATSYFYVVIITVLFFLAGKTFLLNKDVVIYAGIIAGLATLARYGYYFALHHAEASYVAPFTKLITIFSVLSAWIFLNEQPSSRLLFGAAFIFFGGYLILEKQNKKWIYLPRFDLAVLLAVGYSLVVAGRGVADKIAVQHAEPFLIILLVQYMLTAIDTAIVIVWKPKEIVPFFTYLKENVKLVRIFIAKAVIFLITFLSFYAGLTQGTLNKILPIANIDSLFIALFAVVFLGERMSKQRILGTILTIFGAILVTTG